MFRPCSRLSSTFVFYKFTWITNETKCERVENWMGMKYTCYDDVIRVESAWVRLATVAAINGGGVVDVVVVGSVIIAFVWLYVCMARVQRARATKMVDFVSSIRTISQNSAGAVQSIDPCNGPPPRIISHEHFVRSMCALHQTKYTETWRIPLAFAPTQRQNHTNTLIPFYRTWFHVRIFDGEKKLRTLSHLQSIYIVRTVVFVWH